MKYRTIVADPPWPYRWTGDSSTPRAIQYPTMGLLEIAELPVRKFAESESHLYLWITPEFNRRGEGSRIVQWWGFEYVGEIVWEKPSIGMGRFPRTSHEYLLVGRRGKLPFDSRDTHSVQHWPQPAQHSAKPDAAYDLMERVSPGPRLEMFARRQRLGWDTWGNEALEHVSLNNPPDYDSVPAAWDGAVSPETVLALLDVAEAADDLFHDAGNVAAVPREASEE